MFKKIKNSPCPKCGQGEKFFDNLIWMTIKDTARYLGRTENAIRIAVHRGQLTRHKLLGKLYFRRSDIDSLIESSAY